MQKIQHLAFFLLCTFLTWNAYSQQVITQWNFNSVPPDNNNSTGTLTPSLGSGTIKGVGGVNDTTFASGFANGGSTDPASADNSGWNISSFPSQGNGNQTAGIEIAVSTVGFQNVKIRWDQRHSNTSSRFVKVLYSINGTTFIPFSGSATDTLGYYRALTGDSWNNGRMADFSSIAGAEDNPNFKVRIVSSFGPGATSYTASNTGSNYSTSGTWRFDMVTIEGAAIQPPAAFDLLTPADNTRLLVRTGSTDNVDVTWGSSTNATTYKWFLDVTAGNFSAPLLALASNSGGTSTTLTLNSGNVDAFLATNGILPGDSIDTKWMVRAYNAVDSVQSTSIFNLRLVRDTFTVGTAFSLLTPADGARVETSAQSADVVVSWESLTGANKYVFFLDNKGGDFSNPLAQFDSDDNGTDTTMTAQISDIDQLLDFLGVLQGDSVDAIWMVRAYIGTDSVQSTETFDIRFVREKPVSVFSASILNVGVYPNPSSNTVFIHADELIESITVFNLNGQKVTETVTITTSVDVSSLPRGVYAAVVKTVSGISRVSFIKE